MKVSKKNLVLAGVMFDEEAKKFAHAFMAWSKIAHVRECYEAGDVAFTIAEMDSPEKEISEKYVNAVHYACRTLFLLDNKFYRSEHMHVVCRLENLEDMETALEEIENFISA